MMYMEPTIPKILISVGPHGIYSSKMRRTKLYLQLLLKYKKGAKNYKDLRQINNKQCETFEEACAELGLLQNDDHWIKCMQEAAEYKIAYALRELFCKIYILCQRKDSLMLYEKIEDQLCEENLCTNKLQRFHSLTNSSNAMHKTIYA